MYIYMYIFSKALRVCTARVLAFMLSEIIF